MKTTVLSQLFIPPSRLGDRYRSFVRYLEQRLPSVTIATPDRLSEESLPGTRRLVIGCNIITLPLKRKR